MPVVLFESRFLQMTRSEYLTRALSPEEVVRGLLACEQGILDEVGKQTQLYLKVFF